MKGKTGTAQDYKLKDYKPGAQTGNGIVLGVIS